MTILTPESDYTRIHIPVLLEEVLEALSPKPHSRILDGTVGMGGHAEALLERAGEGAELCGFDRDSDALDIAEKRLAPFGKRVHLQHRRFSQVLEGLDELGWAHVDTVLVDIGVSSLQIDDPSRGFSFMSDAPLDMRMDQSDHDASLWDLVNRERFENLKDMITQYGEDPQAGRIARSIITARDRAPINTTLELANIIYQAYPPAWRAKARNHPATRTFQAFRIVINNEFGELKQFLQTILARLSIGGRLAVISFHSIEDRLAKHSMRAWAQACVCPKHIPRCVCRHQPEVKILTNKPIIPSLEEQRRNPRAGSAKLRVIEKIRHPVRRA